MHINVHGFLKGVPEITLMDKDGTESAVIAISQMHVQNMWVIIQHI